MHIKYLLFCLLASCFLLASCSDTEIRNEKRIVKKWQFGSVKNAGGQDVKTISKGDIMALTGDKKFSYVISKENIKASGEWSMEHDTLSYVYNPKESSNSVDSTSYTVKDGVPAVTYFQKGKALATVQGNGLSPTRLTRRFKIIKLDDTNLVLKENDITFTYFYRNEQVSGIGFTWSGFLNGMIGVFGLTCIAFLLSNKKRRINWALIVKALLLQFLFAFCILKVPVFREVFGAVAGVFVTILSFTRAGSTFLFGGLVSNTASFGFIFVFQILPTIIFFAALTSALFYANILQKLVYAFAWVMKRVMNLSGAVSLASAANIFVGQTEAPLVIKPYISGMTKSETMALMTGGMAHISGGVLAAYIGFLGGTDPEQQRLFATHLLSASIMTAPGTFFAAKLMIPETEDFNKDLAIPRQKIGSNILDAIANGTSEGLRLAVNVAAMLMVFIAFMAMLNYCSLHFIGSWTGLNDRIVAQSHGRYEGLTLQYMLGYVFYPISLLIGIRGDDAFYVGQLLGQKSILNEFVAYIDFSKLKDTQVLTNPKTIIITTYALCGFANFASIGIQLGGIGTLAPTKRAMLAQLGIKALIAGTIANLLSAAIAGMMI